MSVHIKRIFCFTLAAVLLCALSACVSTPAVSEPESSAAATTAATTAAATSAGTTADTSAPTTAAETSAPTQTTFSPERLAEDHAEAIFRQLFPDKNAEKAAYESYKKMSYKEYFSEPRFLFTQFLKYQDVFPKSDDPTVLYFDSDPDRIYFDAKKYKKDAKAVTDGGYDGDGVVDYFCVDNEVWRWHIPTDTMDVVVKHDNICAFYPISNDFGYCIGYDPERNDDVLMHYHVFSKNLTIPYEDVPRFTEYFTGHTFAWFMENVYNKT